MKILLIFTLYLISVIYRNLSLQDAGLYQCGETGGWKQTVNLKVNSDLCCLGPKTLAGYLGESVTISCSYPENFEEKFLFKQNSQHFTEVIRTSETQRGRFSISDDRRSKVLSVRISDVREDDGGVYYCGVWTGGQSVSYFSLYTETQLQATAPGSSNIIIIIVCVGVGLLLIGALALILYKLRGKIRKEQAVSENDLPGNQISMSPVYQNLEPNNKKLDLAHKSRNPKTNQSEKQEPAKAEGRRRHAERTTYHREKESFTFEEDKKKLADRTEDFNDLSEAEVQFRMKILLVFTLCLISGQVRCFDVIGYSGGSVIIYCKHQRYGVLTKYFCKESPKQCVNVRIQNKWTQNDRLSLRDSSEDLMLIYRNLSLQDAGSYQCGETGEWNQDVNLEVKTDPCCSGPNTVSGDLGETVTISCSYPEQFKTNYQYLFKQDSEGITEVIQTTETQRGRFSISEDGSSAVLSVRIRDVREDDGGVYYCGVWTGGPSVSYYSLYTEIQLQVTAPSSSVIVIIVCVGVALLLIGGSALIYYKLRCTKTQGSISSSKVAKMGSNNRNPQIPHSACYYEEIRDPRPSADTGATPRSVEPPSDPPNAVKDTTQQPSNSPVQHIYSEIDLPTEAHTYATVSIQNEESDTDATVAFHTGKSATMYATVNHPQLE
ncbi:hypothetical protein AOLI_G00233850 [Acnodon oligacanthus]